jgi:ribosome biogenesis protein MAK21
MIVNKFGDPDKKIASKATYNLKQLLNVHPNMANVVIMETEKLIFRNNVTEMAQHQAIGFLSMIARVANVEASQRLINISFSFFKIKIEKGDINSKTMQSILNCLRVAIQNINDFNEEKKKIEIATPEVVNTIYRLIYLSNISIAFQALSLLLQLVLVQENENHDRYYNALYKKMSDLEINNVNNRISSLYFHILHRSIQQDPNVPRAKAFLKRLLQMAQEFPAAKTCGALIVISKILKSRPELASFRSKSMETPQRLKKDKSELSSKFDNDDDDGDEVYRDVLLDDKGNEIQTNVAKKNNESKPIFSWMHVKNSAQENGGVEKSKQKEEVTKYDPYKRS